MMSQRCRIVKSGFRSPLGENVHELAHAWLSSCGTNVPKLDPSAIRSMPLPSGHERILSPIANHALQLGCEVMKDVDGIPPERLGLFVGMGGLRAQWPDLVPVLANQSPGLSDSWQRGLKNLHPFWMLKHLSNNVHALLAREVGARGEGFTFGGGNAGTQALEAACTTLHSGALDLALVVAYDSLFEPELVHSQPNPSEAAVALLLARDDGQSVTVAARSGVNLGGSREDLLSYLRPCFMDECATVYWDDESILGNVGAAAPLLQAALCSSLLGESRAEVLAAKSPCAVYVSLSEPDLYGVVQLCLPL